jgi:hypothetical protein
MHQTSLVVFGKGFYLSPPSIVYQNALWKSFREFPVNRLANPSPIAMPACCKKILLSLAFI